MKKRKWLSEDAVTRAPLPFDPTQTRLQLLGFFIAPNQSYPAAIEMALEHGGRSYRSDVKGYVHQLPPRSHELRSPDISATAGAGASPGMVAYALASDRIIVGYDWQVRRELREVLKSGELAPAAGLKVLEHLQGQVREVMLARAYEQGGMKAYENAGLWTDLRHRIRATRAQPRAAQPA